MKYSYAIAGLAALATASDVHDLTKDTFDDFLSDNGLVLAEFFAPWCGHCKALAPEYEEAATTLKDKEIALAKVDCTAEAELCQEQGVEGYPTLKVFRGNKDSSQPYQGQRKSQAIVSYMTKMALPAVSELGPDPDALEAFKTADNIVLVAYLAAGDKASNASFTEVADALRESFLFGATSDAALAKAEGVKQPSIVLYKTFDEGKAVFDKAFTVDDITQFAKVASTPLIGEIGPETYSSYMSAGIPLAYIFAESEEERSALALELKPVAEKHKGAVNFGTINAQDFGQHAGNINLEVGKWPAFAIQDTGKNEKFPYPKQGDASELSAKKIGAFVDEYVAGKIEPSIKSEPVPEKQEGPVTVVVAKSYNDVVINNDKDVLVEFYAPWCGHCKALAPKYDELAAMFGSFAEQVTIAKIDATANDVPDEISGFPTIKLFRAGEKTDPLVYSGARSVEDLANFVRDNGSHHIDALAAAAEATPAVETDDMPQQAPAATDRVKDAAGSVAEVIQEAIFGDESGAEEHDEL